MIIEANIDPAQLAAASSEISDELEFAAMDIQSAMARAYVDVVAGNLGNSGVDRPSIWPPLSERYAKKMGRTYATLYVTGALAGAIKVDDSSEEQSTVSVSDDDCPYAVAHQYGYPPRNLPARPYFPFDPQTGETTSFTLDLVQQAAQDALDRHFSRLGGVNG